jgi:uncharacterized membrane protein YfcA
MQFEYQDIFLIFLGLLVGSFGTLIGAGGGFILMPVLILLWPDRGRDVITSVSLAVVFVNAFSGSLAYMRMKRVDIKSGLMFAAATIPGAILGAYSTHYIPKDAFDVVFGVLMVSLSIYLFFRSRNLATTTVIYVRGVRRHIIEKDGTEHYYSFRPGIGIVISLFIGYLSSMLGIGGGIIHVPVLVDLLNFPIHIATATSHFTLAISALTGTIEHIREGTLSTVVWPTIFISMGVYAGAKVGAKLSKVVKGKFIIKGLSLALCFVGLRILLVALHLVK